MSKQGNQVNLTTLSPIEYRQNDPDDRILQVRDYLSEEEQKPPEDQLLASCPMVHMARIQVLNDILPAMGSVHYDALKSRYLLMVVSITGEIDDFLDALYNGPNGPAQAFSWFTWGESTKRHADFVANLWGKCIGYPDQAGSVFFRRYIKRCLVPTTLPFAAYDHSVSDILNFQSRQTRFIRFVQETQQLSDPDLQAEWQKFAAQEFPDRDRS